MNLRGEIGNGERDGLFDRDRFCQVARLIDIAAAAHRDVVSQQLQRHNLDQRSQQLERGRNVNHVLHQIADRVSPSVATAITRPERAVTSWIFESVFS